MHEGAWFFRTREGIQIGGFPSLFDAELAAYDARRAVREPTTPDKQRNVDKFGAADPYTWSEDKARQYHVPERHSFGPYVRGQGFALK